MESKEAVDMLLVYHAQADIIGPQLQLTQHMHGIPCFTREHLSMARAFLTTPVRFSSSIYYLISLKLFEITDRLDNSLSLEFTRILYS